MSRATWLIGSRFLGTLAFQVLGFGAYLEVFRVSGSPLATGGVGLALFLPTFFLTLVAGITTDRVRSSGRLYALLQFAQIGVIALASTGVAGLPRLFLAVALLSSLRALRSPLFYSLLCRSTPAGAPQRARLSTLSWQLPLLLGPLLVTTSESLLGPGAPVKVAVAIQVLAALASLPTSDVQSSSAPRPRVDLLAALRSLHADRELSRPLYADALFAAALGLNVFLPFRLRELGFAPESFAALRSLFSGAALLTSFGLPSAWLVRFQARNFARLLFVSGLIAFGLALTSSRLLFTTGLFLLGVLDGVSILFREHLVLERVAPEAMGRVSAANSLLVSTGDELGDFTAGFAQRTLGIAGQAALILLLASLLAREVRPTLEGRSDVV